VHLSPGPAWAMSDCGLVRVPAGARFPWHVHDGEEVTVVLSGRARYPDGRELGPGDEMVVADGAEHDFVVGPDEDYVFAVRFGAVRPAMPPPGHP
jgi:quercetin dioxygenase-like cupin family protein